MATAEHNLIGVFRDERGARAAADAAVEAGVERGRIRIADPTDAVGSLRGEMGEEMGNTVAGPGNVGPFTKEATKGIGVTTPVATVAGALLALPLALLPLGGLSLAVRLLIAAAVGAAAGATLGLVVGGGLGAKGPGEKLAAERGVTLGISFADAGEADRVAQALRRQSPIRLDVVRGDGQPELRGQ
jgi:hypothetical protein